MMSVRSVFTVGSLMLLVLWLCTASAQVTETKLVPSDGVSGDGFGMAVAVDGDYLVVGAPQSDPFGSQSGSAYVFERSGDTWIEQQKLLPSDGAYGARFGMAVSIDSDYALIGAYTDPEIGISAGAVYVFKRDSITGAWSEQTKLKASDGEAGDLFGFSVSLQGRCALIGAMEDEDEAGAAFVYERTDTVWTEQQKLTASGGVGTALFGRSVSLSGDYAIIGAPYDDEIDVQSGAAYIFRLDGGYWTQQAKLRSSDMVANDFFGFSVAISGDYAIVGALSAWGIENSAGSAYMFERNGTTWTERGKLIDSTGIVGLGFGYCVSIDGDYAIVGQPEDDDNGNASGSVFLFERQGGIWQQVVKLLASDGEGGDLLGWSVFMDHDEVFAGAATQSAGGTYSGAAYVFTDFPTEIHEERVAGFSSNPVLNQNRPNPFTSITQLSYALARTSQVSLKVYDASGQLVYTLVDETVGPGYHVAEWHGKSESGSDAPSGIYFCRIQVDDFTSTKKMILLR